MSPLIVSIITFLVIGMGFIGMFVKIIPEYERIVVFFLGRVSRALVGGTGPGLIVIIPGLYSIRRVDMRTITLDVPTQEVITRDNVPVKVNAVIYFRVVDPIKAIIDVENFVQATSQFAQTTLRSVLGQSELDELLSKREKINHDLQVIIDEHTDPWGIKVSNVEVKDVELPPEMRRAMAKQAEAERERRAKVIHAQGESDAAEKLTSAADIIAQHPIALQLRYLQTLTEIAVDKNTTMLFPIPIDLIKPFLEGAMRKEENNKPQP